MATDEGSLLAAARAEGKVLVAPGTVIALTKRLLVKEKASDWESKNYHCEPRPSSGPPPSTTGHPYYIGADRARPRPRVPLGAGPQGLVQPLPHRRPRGNRQQCRRTRPAPDRHWPEELALRGLR